MRLGSVPTPPGHSLGPIRRLHHGAAATRRGCQRGDFHPQVRLPTGTKSPASRYPRPRVSLSLSRPCYRVPLPRNDPWEAPRGRKRPQVTRLLISTTWPTSGLPPSRDTGIPVGPTGVSSSTGKKLL
ncbi:hypothetical protein BJX61DRAFT_230033 [Aspergillus egyptiacus]|nr:hypothetical protein BJX61DRAFT_230033 [Aspergillus egyptiacus]